MTRVTAPSRLHFGLLAPKTGTFTFAETEKVNVPVFGGVGLMLAEPRICVSVREADAWSATGPDAERALQAGQRLLASLPDEQRRAFSIQVEEAIDAHAGLGSGTALALATAKALAIAMGYADWSSVELARRVGRGERSAVGIHGFEHGGLIVELGKQHDEAIAPLAQHRRLPEHWRVLLVRPALDADWHGVRERQAFAQMTRANPAEVMKQIVSRDMLPAVDAMDIDRFGNAVHEYNRLAGEAFIELQGGPYAHPAIAELIAQLRKLGVTGAGQSSWGPTVFGIVESGQQGRAVVRQLQLSTGTTIQVCHFANAGASIERLT